MAINGLGEFGGFYNNYRVVDIPKVDVETVKKQDELAAKELSNPQVSTSITTEEPKVDNRSKNADLENISLNFNKGDDYSYIGSDSDIEKLDMQKAISDMRKDKILEGYQYFVGSSQNLMGAFNSADGSVFLK